MPLNDAKLRTLKPESKPRKVSDFEGLFVLVNPNGSRLWRLAYRFAGKQKVLALGAYPEMSLRDARKAKTGRNCDHLAAAEGRSQFLRRKVLFPAERTSAAGTRSSR